MWHVPDAAATAVDRHYVLCALGLLALTGQAGEQGSGAPAHYRDGRAARS